MPTAPSTRATAQRGKETANLKVQAGSWLREQRQKAGLSQIDLANRLGMKYYTFISQIENGYGRVPSQSMAEWGRALGIRPAQGLLVSCSATTTPLCIASCSRTISNERSVTDLC